jgi:hypothetical protein
LQTDFVAVLNDPKTGSKGMRESKERSKGKDRLDNQFGQNPYCFHWAIFTLRKSNMALLGKSIISVLGNLLDSNQTGNFTAPHNSQHTHKKKKKISSFS